MKLADRSAVVTGAAKGMGRDICLTLAREGANLTIAAREAGPLEALGREITALGRQVVGLRGYRFRAAYSSSKWALRGFTRTVALEAGPYNINVNALHPGIVGGDRMDKLCREKAKKRGWTPEQVYQEYVDEMALKRVTVAQDIANAVLFLVSDDSSNMTGQSVTVDGGWDV